MKFTRSRNGSTLLTEEIELHSFCSRDGVAAGFIESNNLHFIRITETNPMLIWEIFVSNSSLEKFRKFQLTSRKRHLWSLTRVAQLILQPLLLPIYITNWPANAISGAHAVTTPDIYDSTVPLTEEILNEWLGSFLFALTINMCLASSVGRA
ncbi:hypothetical protein OUZ56_023447 [Daphnia magna]|uniref:Uncharacterized protein n=1 Tax=Daphnia magna TaxID=35525 RepID=A0ABR0AZ55_9CRUS|nr:hypothetical protein OUZ56_023447 [Daphnia magna]